MILSDQSTALKRLPLTLRQRAERDYLADFSNRLKQGLFVYPVLMIIIWFSTTYWHEHPSFIIAVSGLVITGVALRTFAIVLERRQQDLRAQLFLVIVTVSTVLLSLPLGLLQAHSILIYGFANWNFSIIEMFICGISAGSTVSFAPSFSLMMLQLFGLLLPELIVGGFRTGGQAHSYLFGTLAFIVFSAAQGKKLGVAYWDQLVDRYLEELRKKEIEDARHTAERAVKARSEFVANMSHEIRTPMNAVVGITTLILDQDLPEETLRYVQVIRSASDALLTVINDILDFSKIESGKLTLENQPFSIRTCVEDVLEVLSDGANDKQTELLLVMDANVSDWILGDNNRVRQVLLNLVGNAVKFTEKGEITVSVEMATNVDGRQIQVSVKDTGIGISAENLDNLFRPFTQADNSATRRFGGTGLGLTISKRLVELMAGRIWAVSELGHGSTFQFLIPCIPASVQDDSADSMWEGKRVLVADDNATSRSILSKYLSEWGIESVSFASSKQAIEDAAATTWDLAILDYQMPEMSGMELADAFRTALGSLAPPIILMKSGFTGSKDFSNNKADRIAGLLTKPVRRAHLNRMISRIFKGDLHTPAPASHNRIDGGFAAKYPLDILLAEDNLINQKIAVHLLGRLGYQPSTVMNGLEVLDALGRSSFDIILMSHRMTFLNGGPAQALTPAFSYSVLCKDQSEIDRYWDKLVAGGQPMACGWLTDKFGLCWQIVPEKIGEILKHPKAMAAMMNMIKFDVATLEAAAKE